MPDSSSPPPAGAGDHSLAYESLREIVTGSVAGAVSKFVEFPFDTVKVRMQYSQSLPEPLYKSDWDCIAQSYKKDGLVKGFYHGVVPPMFGSAMEISTLFFSYNLAQDLIKSYTKEKELGQGAKLGCGAFSGVCTSLVLTPIELIKCRMQVETLQGGVRKSVPEMVAAIVSENGVQGLWKGEMSTLYREAGGSMAWFGNYEFTLAMFSGGDPDYEFKAWQLMTAGAMAGVGYNGVMFPVDTVKSIYQISDGSQTQMQVARQIWQTKGFRGFYSGLGVTLFKTVPASAVLFLTYEYVKALWP